MASIVCRNEVQAPCPSYFQKCCDRDDISFHGTPVETSAPLPSTDAEPLTASLSPALSQDHQQTPPHPQSTPPAQTSSQSTRGPEFASSDERKQQTSQVSPDLDANSRSVPQQNPDSTSDPRYQSSITTLYFLSSSNGSNIESSDSYSRSDPAETHHSSSLSVAQSFDDANGSKIPGDQTSTQLPTSSDQHMTAPVETSLGQGVLEILNGTILLNKSSSVERQRRPSYANWTDYHFAILNGKTSQSSTTIGPVVYRSNTDPAKRFIADQNKSVEAQVTIVPISGFTTEKSMSESDDMGLKDFPKSGKGELSETGKGNSSDDRSPDSQEDPANPIVSGVGEVLVNLFDSWIGGSSYTTTTTEQPPSAEPELAKPNATVEQVNQDKPQNDRRLGLDISSRQPIQQLDQAFSSSESASSDSRDTQVNVKCSGYCTLPLFTMLCDSTYRSMDCGSSQKCCVIGQTDSQSSVGQSNERVTGTEALGPAGDLQQSIRPNPADQNVCRGLCIPIYHLSLCAKPNELQLDSLGCLPNFVCCGQQSESDQIDLSDSSGLATAASSVEPTYAATSSNGDLLASLVPPMPPSIGGSANSDQYQAVDLAVARQRPQIDQIDLSRTVKSNSRAQPIDKSAGQSSTFGFMNSIYQMFSRTSDKVTRQKSQPKPQQNPLQLQTVGPTMNSHIYELPAGFQMRNVVGQGPQTSGMFQTHLSPVVYNSRPSTSSAIIPDHIAPAASQGVFSLGPTSPDSMSHHPAAQQANWNGRFTPMDQYPAHEQMTQSNYLIPSSSIAAPSFQQHNIKPVNRPAFVHQQSSQQSDLTGLQQPKSQAFDFQHPRPALSQASSIHHPSIPSNHPKQVHQPARYAQHAVQPSVKQQPLTPIPPQSVRIAPFRAAGETTPMKPTYSQESSLLSQLPPSTVSPPELRQIFSVSQPARSQPKQVGQPVRVGLDSAVRRGQQKVDGQNRTKSSDLISSSSSNVSVMINRNPFIDLQRVDSPRIDGTVSSINLPKASPTPLRDKQNESVISSQKFGASSATIEPKKTGKPNCPAEFTCLGSDMQPSCLQMDLNYSCPNHGSICCTRMVLMQTQSTRVAPVSLDDENQASSNEPDPIDEQSTTKTSVVTSSNESSADSDQPAEETHNKSKSSSNP